MLLQATANVAKNVIRTEATLVPRKLDWMITEKLDELRNIMRDNATYIQFPAVGMMSPSITVLGASRVSVQRTIRFINQMVCVFIYIIFVHASKYAFDRPANTTPR